MLLSKQKCTVCSCTCFISRFSPLYPTPPGFRIPISMTTLDKVGGWCYHSRLPHRRSQPYGLFMNLHDSTRPTEIFLEQLFLSLKASDSKQGILTVVECGGKVPRRWSLIHPQSCLAAACKFLLPQMNT